MAHLINKDALVAELNRLIAELVEEGEDTMFEQGRISAFEDVKVFINHILKVKEMDWEKECRKYLTEHFNVYEDDILQSKRSGMPLDTFDVIQVAKHFFELGLKAQKGE